MYICRYVDKSTRMGMGARPTVLNGVHAEHGLAMHKWLATAAVYEDDAMF